MVLTWPALTFVVSNNQREGMEHNKCTFNAYLYDAHYKLIIKISLLYSLRVRKGAGSHRAGRRVPGVGSRVGC